MTINNVKFIVLIVLIFVGIASAQQQKKTGTIIGSVTYAMLPWFKSSFLEIADDVDEAAKNNKHVLLFFHLDECPYCNQMVRDFNQPPLKNFIQQYFDVIAINIRGDREVEINETQSLSEKQLSAKIGVQYTPTVVFLNQKNKIITRTNGYRNPKKMKQILEYIREKKYTELTLSQYIDKTKKLENYQLQSHAMFKSIDNLSTIKKPLAVIFEDNNCDACTYFYNTTLKDQEVINEFNAFDVVRFDANSMQIIVDNQSNKRTVNNWVQQLKLTYRPGIVLFDKGREITRIDGFLHPFHFKEVLRYVSGGFYQNFATYNAYLANRQDELIKQGVNININK